MNAIVKSLPRATDESVPPLCRRAGRVSVTLTRGQMNLLDSMIATGLFVSRPDVLRYLIAKGAASWLPKQ